MWEVKTCSPRVHMANIRYYYYYYFLINVFEIIYYTLTRYSVIIGLYIYIRADSNKRTNSSGLKIRFRTFRS